MRPPLSISQTARSCLPKPARKSARLCTWCAAKRGCARSIPAASTFSNADLAAFSAALTSANHTLKRALTDPRLFSGIGNAYSDEILHRARLSPVALTQKLQPDEIAAPVRCDSSRPHRVDRRACVPMPAARFPRRSPPSAKTWRYTAATASRARSAARKSSASATPRTKPTTARAARPAAACSPTAHSPACLREDWPRTLEELEALPRRAVTR